MSASFDSRDRVMAGDYTMSIVCDLQWFSQGQLTLSNAEYRHQHKNTLTDKMIYE